jgi:hypothetical protein
MVEYKTPENIPFKFDPPKLWGFIFYNIGMAGLGGCEWPPAGVV